VPTTKQFLKPELEKKRERKKKKSSLNFRISRNFGKILMNDVT
jgi:hypothetical protein